MMLTVGVERKRTEELMRNRMMMMRMRIKRYFLQSFSISLSPKSQFESWFIESIFFSSSHMRIRSEGEGEKWNKYSRKDSFSFLLCADPSLAVLKVVTDRAKQEKKKWTFASVTCIPSFSLSFSSFFYSWEILKRTSTSDGIQIRKRVQMRRWREVREEDDDVGWWL